MVDRIQDQVRQLIVPVVEAAGYDCEEITVRTSRPRLVKVLLDSDTGVSLDEVSIVSKEISRVLDDDDVMGSASYSLEVSSPGVERPLTLPRHWRRNAGRLVKILRDDQAPVVGRIEELAADDSAVLIKLDDCSVVPVQLASITRAQVQVELGGK